MPVQIYLKSYITVTTADRFVVLFSVQENLGNEPDTIAAYQLRLQDSSGRLFDSSSYEPLLGQEKFNRAKSMLESGFYDALCADLLLYIGLLL